MPRRHARLAHTASLLLMPAAAILLLGWPRRVTETAAAAVVAISAVSDALALQQWRAAHGHARATGADARRAERSDA